MSNANLLIAQELGPQAFCLVDLGHHAPNVNIEQIVSRLIFARKLGGFHFNDAKYGDDDLDAGSVDPFRLFLVFNELVEVQNGAARLPDRPGLGLTLRDDIVDAHPYEPYTRHSLFTTDGRPTPS